MSEKMVQSSLETPHRGLDAADVTINGRFLTRRTTGVQRYAGEVLKAISLVLAAEPDWAERLKFNIRLPSDVTTAIPNFLSFASPRWGHLQGYAWEQIELPRRKEVSLNLCNLAPILGGSKVVCIHDANVFLAPYSYTWKYRTAQRVIMPLLGRTASVISTVSKASADSLINYGVIPNEKKIVIAPNGHEHVFAWKPERSKIKIESITHQPFILMLGGQAPHKNSRLVSAIAPELALRGIDCIVTGHLDNVFTSIRNQASGIHFIGFVDDDDIALLLSSAICLIFPSFVEGFGLPVVEAMALGCPVIAANCSCMPEICGDAALLCSPYDPSAWINAITQLKNDKEERKILIQKGYNRCLKYSWLSTAKIYLQVLSKLAHGEGA